MVVTFNKRLTGAFSAVNNFGYYVGVFEWLSLVNAPMIDYTVTCTMNMGAPDARPTSCEYNAAPPDVISLYGIPAAAFVGFPVTVIP